MKQLVRTPLVVAVSLLASMPVQGADASTSPCKRPGGIRSAAPLQLTKPGQLTMVGAGGLPRPRCRRLTEWVGQRRNE